MINQKIHFHIINSSNLSCNVLDAMWSIYSQDHNVTKEEFLKRTLEKFDKITIFSNGKDMICGFNGTSEEKINVNNKKYNAIYLGQSFIKPEYRGNTLIQRSMLKITVKSKIKHPFTPLFIWDDNICYKPYLLICNYVPKYYPSCDWKTPANYKKLIDFVGQRNYKEFYCSQLGVVEKKINRLKDHVAPINKKELENKYIQYFVKANPNYHQGHGLICIIPFNLGNVIRFIFKISSKKIKKIRNIPVEHNEAL